MQEGISKDRRVGNLRFFRLNQKYFLYNELKGIIIKTIGLEDRLKKLIKRIPGIEYAFIFEKNIQRRGEGNVELLIVGSKKAGECLKEEIVNLENKSGRKINFYLYNKEEIRDKLINKNKFITKTWQGQKTILKGDSSNIN